MFPNLSPGEIRHHGLCVSKLVIWCSYEVIDRLLPCIFVVSRPIWYIICVPWFCSWALKYWADKELLHESFVNDLRLSESLPWSWQRSWLVSISLFPQTIFWVLPRDRIIGQKKKKNRYGVTRCGLLRQERPYCVSAEFGRAGPSHVGSL